MKIRTKILLLFTMGALVPLLLSQFFGLRMIGSSIRELSAEALTRQTAQAAGRLEDRVAALISEIEAAAESVPFDHFSSAELARALEIPYRQVAEATIVALLDKERRAVVPPFSRSSSEAERLGREPVSAEDLAAFAQHVPHRLALNAGLAVGPAYQSSSKAGRVVVAKAVSVGEGAEQWVLAVEISLRSICEVVYAHNLPRASAARLFDIEGRNLCPALAGGRSWFERLPGASQLAARVGRAAEVHDTPEGRRVLGAVAEISLLGWRLSLEQPLARIEEPVGRAFRWVGLWIAVAAAIALLGGAVLASGITRPLAGLERAATRVAQGEYDKPLDIVSKDEVGRVAEAFNRMATDIRAWNAELVARVDERTMALREAQEQIWKTQKLAAVGELGSGVAHEINNPLTGVLGMAELLETELEPGSQAASFAREIKRNGRRVAEIVEGLLLFSQSQLPPQMQPLSVGTVARSVWEMFAERFKERKLRCSIIVDDEARAYASSPDLRLALSHVIDNAVRASGPGGQVELRVEQIEGGAVQISICDEGPGMSDETRLRATDPFFTTQPPGSGARGLGLSVVQRIMKEHDGQIVLDSKVGQGTRVKLYLPGAPRLTRS